MSLGSLCELALFQVCEVLYLITKQLELLHKQVTRSLEDYSQIKRYEIYCSKDNLYFWWESDQDFLSNSVKQLACETIGESMNDNEDTI